MGVPHSPTEYSGAGVPIGYILLGTSVVREACATMKLCARTKLLFLRLRSWREVKQTTEENHFKPFSFPPPTPTIMECLAATYDWKAPSNTATASSSSSSHGRRCACLEMSTAEQEVQQLRAKEELVLLRDRVRKSLTKWLGESPYRNSNSKSASIHIDWQVEASQLVQYLCYWEHTSALNKVSMTDCLVEVSRQHRRLEGATSEPPASKNRLMLVVWDLAATVQAKLRQRHEYILAEEEQEEQEDDNEEKVEEEAFDGAIVVRTSDLVPIWIWEADILRTRPALMDVCNRMMGMELWHYRQHCQETTPAEKQLLRDHEPYLTPMGRRWRARTLAPRQQLSSTPASCMPARAPISGRSLKSTLAKHNNKTNTSATSDPRLNRAKATSSNTQPRNGRNSFKHDEDYDAESDVNSSTTSTSSSSRSSSEDEEVLEVEEEQDEEVTNGNDVRGKSTNKGRTTSSLSPSSAAAPHRASRPKPRKGTTH